MADLTTSDPGRWLLALVAATVIAIAGYRVRALGRSGALAAVGTGTTLVGAGGWWTGLMIVAFFASSSALSRLAPSRRPRVRSDRGERRDAVQVLANGGVPVVLAVISRLASDPAPWLVGAACAVAGACADTWATEIGRTSPTPPRLITTWRTAPSGSSGAISGRGTLGALAGACSIALLATTGNLAGWWLPARNGAAIGLTVIAAGFAAALVDSLLGATVQAEYWCPCCGMPAETSNHDCGTRATLRRGHAAMTNDAVNALATLTAGVVGTLSGWLLGALWTP